MFGFRTADPERVHFNEELKTPLLELLKSFDKMADLDIAPKFEKAVETKPQAKRENVINKILREGPHHDVQHHLDTERGL